MRLAALTLHHLYCDDDGGGGGGGGCHQVVRHKKFDYRGVIIGWDHRPTVDVSRWDGVVDLPSKDKQVSGQEGSGGGGHADDDDEYDYSGERVDYRLSSPIQSLLLNCYLVGS